MHYDNGNIVFSVEFQRKRGGGGCSGKMAANCLISLKIIELESDPLLDVTNWIKCAKEEVKNSGKGQKVVNKCTTQATVTGMGTPDPEKIADCLKNEGVDVSVPDTLKGILFLISP